MAEHKRESRICSESAQRTLGPVDRVAAQLRPYLDVSARLARHHYIERGTLRHFEVRYEELAALPEAVTHPIDADGLVVVVLCESVSAIIRSAEFTPPLWASSHASDAEPRSDFPKRGISRSVPREAAHPRPR